MNHRPARSFAWGVCLLLAQAALVIDASAQIPHLLNYQGYLVNPANSQPIDATVSMQFKLYNIASGGAPLFSETQSVAVAAGVFNVQIGAITTLNLPFDVPYFLGITVDADAEMTPRQKVASSAYALRAEVANALNPSAAVAGSQITGSITAATLPAANLAGTIGTTQIAGNSITQGKLSPLSGAAPNKVLGTDGTNLQWQTDANAGGTVTSLTAGSGITLTPATITTSGTIAADTTFLQRRVAAFCPPGSIIHSIGVDGSVTCQLDGPANAFVNNGNAFAAPAVLGTTDNQPLNIEVNGQRAFRIEPVVSSVLGFNPNVIGGQAGNAVSPGFSGATIGGGGGCLPGTGGSCMSGPPHTISNDGGTIGGGRFNSVSAIVGTVAGGQGNTASGFFGSFVGGGSVNTASGQQATVGGGVGNTASGEVSTIPGGESNVAAGKGSFVAGFRAKNSTAGHSGVFLFADGVGINNPVDFVSVAANEFAARATGGVRFVTAIDGATGNPTSTFSITPEGRVGVNTPTPDSVATMTVSDAGGPTILLRNTVSNQAEAGRIRFADQATAGNCLGAYVHYSGSANVFNIGTHPTSNCVVADDQDAISIARSTGFVGVLSAPTAFPISVGTGATNGNGAHLTVGGVWTNGSSRAFKEGFTPVDPGRVLASVVSLPIATWRYRGPDDSLHMGPVAEDFHAAFGLGHDNRYIGTVDADGVALAAIQGVNAKLDQRTKALDSALREKDAEIRALRSELGELRRMIGRLAGRP